jgi:hypothetical protein
MDVLQVPDGNRHRVNATEHRRRDRASEKVHCPASCGVPLPAAAALRKVRILPRNHHGQPVFDVQLTYTPLTKKAGQMSDIPRQEAMYVTSQIVTHARAICKQLERETPNRDYMLMQAKGIRDSAPALVETLERWPE